LNASDSNSIEYAKLRVSTWRNHYSKISDRRHTSDHTRAVLGI